MRRGTTTASLIEQKHVVTGRIEETTIVGIDPSPWPPVKKNCGLGASCPDPLVVNCVSVADFKEPSLEGVN